MSLSRESYMSQCKVLQYESVTSGVGAHINRGYGMSVDGFIHTSEITGKEKKMIPRNDREVSLNSKQVRRLLGLEDPATANLANKDLSREFECI